MRLADPSVRIPADLSYKGKQIGVDWEEVTNLY